MAARALVLLALLAACSTAAASPPPPASSPPPPATAAVVAPPPESLPIAAYPWAPAASDERLNARFATPSGFTRVVADPDSFGRFLRALPLQPAGAPVLDYRGVPLHENGHHPNIVAVADLDVGEKNLQHCADAIIRLNAEWRYGKGERAIAYKAVSGQNLAYQSYLGGERAVVDGKGIVFKHVAGAQKDAHPVMRGWMDEVFAWAGTASLEATTKKVAWSDLAPGDFFVQSGSPYGHAVLVLDVAKDDKGRVALLLGQSYMPAQTFQILKPNSGTATNPWFIVDPDDLAVDTPFWPAFPKTTLHRFS